MAKRSLKSRSRSGSFQQASRRSKPKSVGSKVGPRAKKNRQKPTREHRSTWNRVKFKEAHEPIEIIARGVLMLGSRVLLCKNPRKNYYYLPGGHVEIGEPAAQALRREFVEECGLDVRVGNLILVTEHAFNAKRAHHEINLVFHVEPPHPGDPIRDATQLLAVRSLEPGLEIEWVDLASIVDLNLFPASAKALLASGFRGVLSHDDRGATWISEMGSAP